MKRAAERGLVLAEPITLLDIPEEGLLFEENLPKAWLDGEMAVGLPPEMVPRATTDVSVRVEVEVLGEISPSVPIPIPIRVRGHAECRLEATCVRCLDPVAVVLRPKIDATMTPRSDDPHPGHAHNREGRAHGTHPRGGLQQDRPGNRHSDKRGGDRRGNRRGHEPEPEAVGPRDEEETLTYNPRAIDLMAPIREALLLEVPMNPSCADTPSCDRRTKALIDGVNGPASEQVVSEDPRWTALRKLSDPKID
ncbi:MAG: DUF177 domain-containing protein [Deltaproteobacteria bacterium]|nr:DUF177 domain-containing protein [Deltaproteobacteria bacterium]